MKKSKKSQNQSDKREGYFYAQVLSRSIKEILKLKNNFPNLLFKKIEDIHRTINDTGKTKPHIILSDLQSLDPSFF